MTESNAAVIRRYFDAANRRDFAEVMEIYADDVELVLPEGWIGTHDYSGKRAVGDFFGDWYLTFDGGPHFAVEEVHEVGELAAVTARSQARGGRSGIELSSDYFYVFRIRAGQIVHIKFYDDWQQALAAAGLTN